MYKHCCWSCSIFRGRRIPVAIRNNVIYVVCEYIRGRSRGTMYVHGRCASGECIQPRATVETEKEETARRGRERRGRNERESRTYTPEGLIVAFTSAGADREKAAGSRPDAERKEKMPDSQDPRTPEAASGRAGERVRTRARACVSNAEEISRSARELTSPSARVLGRDLGPTRPICAPHAD